MSHEHHPGCGHELSADEMQHLAERIGHICTAECVHVDAANAVSHEQHEYDTAVIQDELIPNEVINESSRSLLGSTRDIELDIFSRLNNTDIQNRTEQSTALEETSVHSHENKGVAKQDHRESASKTKSKLRHNASQSQETRSEIKKKHEPKKIVLPRNTRVPNTASIKNEIADESGRKQSTASKPKAETFREIITDEDLTDTVVRDEQIVPRNESNELNSVAVEVIPNQEATSYILEEDESVTSLLQHEEIAQAADLEIKTERDLLTEDNPIVAGTLMPDKTVDTTPELEGYETTVALKEKALLEVKVILEYVEGLNIDQLSTAHEDSIKRLIHNASNLRSIEDPITLINEVAKGQFLTLSDKLLHELLELVPQPLMKSSSTDPLVQNQSSVIKKLLGRIVLVSFGFKIKQPKNTQVAYAVQ